MTPLGLRPRTPFPATYKGFRLVKGHGRVYGVPPFLELEDVYSHGKFSEHPALLIAATREELERLIDNYDRRSFEPETLASYEGYQLVRHRGRVYGIPPSAGVVDLSLDADRRRAGVVGGASADEVRARIRSLKAAVPVEFAGWLPIFKFSGNCGQHPQFTHTAEPPPGYRFTCSAPPKKRRTWWNRALTTLVRKGRRAAYVAWLGIRPLVGLFRGKAGLAPRARLRVLGAILRLFGTLLRRGARLGAVLRFLQSRHFQSQVMIAKNKGLVFLTSMPYTYGQNPWVVEVEDPTTLFYPLIQNGHTCNLSIAESPYFPIIKALLEADQCKGILTHVRSTARMIATLFGSDRIRDKVFYTPLGVKLPERWQHHEDQEPFEPLDLVFINSWCQVPENFYVRGGLDVLEAFAILRRRYPHLRLTLRTELPLLDDHYHRIVESGWVRVISRFLPDEEMSELLAGSHIFLLPAARIHIVSLLQAMSYGLAVVTSDGWGIEEYVKNDQNGLIVKGRYGKTSWADEKAGMLREDYDPMYTSDPEVVRGLVEAVSSLVEDHALRRRLGRAARRDVEANYSLERWNQGLKEALDRALTPKAGRS